MTLVAHLGGQTNLSRALELPDQFYLRTGGARPTLIAHGGVLNQLELCPPKPLDRNHFGESYCNKHDKQNASPMDKIPSNDIWTFCPKSNNRSRKFMHLFLMVSKLSWAKQNQI